MIFLTYRALNDKALSHRKDLILSVIRSLSCKPDSSLWGRNCLYIWRLDFKPFLLIKTFASGTDNEGQSGVFEASLSYAVVRVPSNFPWCTEHLFSFGLYMPIIVFSLTFDDFFCLFPLFLQVFVIPRLMVPESLICAWSHQSFLLHCCFTSFFFVDFFNNSTLCNFMLLLCFKQCGSNLRLVFTGKQWKKI